MATKKLKPVAETPAVEQVAPATQAATPEAFDPAKLNDLIDRMDTMVQYMEKMDWKLWMLMCMVKMIGEENGYHFDFYQNSSTPTKEPIER